MSAIDLDAYFERIGYAGERAPTLAVLTALQRAHPAAIPFESLDPFLGRPVRIDPASLEAKLLRGGRGGYCFENNGVFWRVLEALGFEVTPLSARVRWMAPDDAPPAPLSHMILRVTLPEGPFLCDVGFGGQSPTAPLRFDPGAEQPTAHGTYRLMPQDAVWELQMRLPDRWAAMYRFNLEPRVLADYETANWFTSTHPDSRFTNNLIASLAPEGRRLNLFNTELTTHFADGRMEQRRIGSPGELHQVLTGTFGLRVDQGEAERMFQRLTIPSSEAARPARPPSFDPSPSRGEGSG
ncbi:MAG TPA: arylamine N-acetyltransferase [Caulobacteraceae bacterium]